MRLGSALHDAAITALARGETKHAMAAIEEALANLQASGNVFHEAHAEVTAGDAFAQGGDPRAARAAYERAQSLFARSDPNGPRVSELAAMVARQDLALGDLDRARAGAEQAMKAFDAGDPLKAPERVIAWRWACAEVLEALGDARAYGMQTQLREAVRRNSMKRAGTPESAHELQQRIPIFRIVMAHSADLTTSPAAF
jgi:tetratricopeptide (TPR) repeat protein